MEKIVVKNFQQITFDTTFFSFSLTARCFTDFFSLSKDKSKYKENAMSYHQPCKTSITCFRFVNALQEVVENPFFCNGTPSHSYSISIAILSTVSNCSNRTKMKEFEPFAPNISKGGKSYGKSKIENGERIVEHDPTNGCRDFCDKQFYSRIMQKTNDKLFHDRKKGAAELRRIAGFSAYKRRLPVITKIDIEKIITAESARICNKLGKSFLDCEDIVALTGLGRDNARALMHSKTFPVIKIGKRQVVSVIAFVTWQMDDYLKGEYGYGKI